MAFRTDVFDFSNASDYTLSQTKLSGNKLTLLEFAKSGKLYSEDFANDTGFTYDSAKAEFTGGKVQTKDVTPANSVMASLLTTKDLAWHKTGSVTGTLNGTPTFSGGEMVCTGTQGVYWTKNTAGQESLKFLYRPNYTTAPPANVNVVSIWNGSNLNDRFALTNSPSGNTLRITLNNSTAGVVIATATTIGGAWTPTAGTQYEIEVVIDSTAGTVRVFINGVLHGTLTPGSWTRGTSASRYYLGASPTIYNRGEADYDNPIFFDNAQHSSGYTPGYTIDPFLYSESEVELPTFTHPGPGVLRSLQSLSTTQAGSPRFTIEGQYWTGSAWAASDGSYAQASPLADVNTNLASLSVDGETVLSASVVFPDTNTLASVDQFDLSHTGDYYYLNGTCVTAPLSCLSANDLISFVESGLVTPAGTSLKYGLAVDGTLKYWTGAAWADSDGSLAQLNTAAEINTNMGTLLTGTNATVCVHIRLETTDDTETSELDQYTVEYEFGGVATTPVKCRVWGYVRDIAGIGIGGATVVFKLIRTTTGEYKEAASNIIVGKLEVTTDDASDPGYFQQDLIRSSEFEGSAQFYAVEVRLKDGTVMKTANDQDTPVSFSVPDSLDKDITDLVTAA